MAEEVVIPAERLRRFADAAFAAAGVPECDRAIVAQSIVDADLRGVHTHGVAMIPGYVRRLLAGGTNPRPAMRLREDGAATVLDADNALGQVAGHRAMSVACERARATGLGAVAVAESSHFGAAAWYAMLALEHDQIGFATTNAGARIAAWGGKQPVVGNNPLAFAIPAGAEWPIVLDMAQSVVAAGKVGMAVRKGEPIPLGWALDQEGRPTTDAREALRGLLVPIGGPKGFGLAVVMDVLAGVLSGGAFGLAMAETRLPERPARVSHFFLALDVARFLPVDAFKARVDELVRGVRESQRAAGVERLYLPGEIEFELRSRRSREGVPLLASIVADLRALGGELGLDDRGLLS